MDSSCLAPAAPLLSREEFRDAVFARDRGACVFCGAPAVDAHHILERRLWPDGGYYLDNGASVCREHHLACERTLISVDEVRAACGIRRALLPPHLYADQAYDKWGNPVLPDGRRLRGELFHDPSVQKALAEGRVLHLFTDRVKYPRTWHLPWSPGMHADDRMLGSVDCFEGRRVVVTEKLDGENTTLYRDGLHARSVDSRNHPSRNWLRAFHARICGDIPVGWRVCGEYLYAQHSIAYDDLQSYFYGFSIWNEQNICLGWDETLEWFALLGIVAVPVLYDGPFDEPRLRALHAERRNGRECEGYVLRVADSFSYRAFRHSVAKYVRAGHVQTTKHWMYGQPIVPNRLAPGVPKF
jgi:hypothetical protein